MALSDVEWIFLILGVLYLFESTCWVRRGLFTISTFFRRCPRWWNGQLPIHNQQGQLVISGPSPSDAIFLAEPIPVSVGSRGIFGWLVASPFEAVRPSGTGLCFEWDSISDIRASEKNVLINRQLFCQTSSAEQAKRLVEHLQQIHHATANERTQQIEVLSRTEFDRDSVLSRLGDWAQRTRILRFSASLLWIWLFVAGLGLYAGIIPGSSKPEVLLAYLAIMFLLWWLTIIFGYRAHRTLYPDRRRSAIRSALMAMISPATTLRTPGHLALELFGFLHPVTLASTLVTEGLYSADAHRALISRVWRDLEYPSLPLTPPDCGPVAEQIASEHHERTQRLLKTFLEQQQMDPASLQITPITHSPDAVAYCPRCLREFAIHATSCADCGDRPITSFNAEPSTGISSN
ncbi:MAG: hypothetical protein ACK526_10185 [Planctomyces sp.]|jgi:hypothetical protein